MERTHLERDIAELKKRIQLGKTYKKRVLDYIYQAKDKYLNREITFHEYDSLINQKSNGRTMPEWVEFYSSYIKDCEKRIEQKKRKHRIKSTFIISFFFIISLILISSIFYLKPTILGFTAKQEKQEFSQPLNLELSKSTDYEWKLENLGELNSVKLSGSVQGDGQVKIYLNNFLILD